MGDARMKSINAAFEQAMRDISVREERKGGALSESASKTAAEPATVKQSQRAAPAAARKLGAPVACACSPGVSVRCWQLWPLLR